MGFIADKSTKLIDGVTGNYLNLNSMTPTNIAKSYLNDLDTLVESENKCQFCYNLVKIIGDEVISSNAKGLTKNEDLRNRHPNIQFRTLLYGDYKHLKKAYLDDERSL